MHWLGAETPKIEGWRAEVPEAWRHARRGAALLAVAALLGGLGGCARVESGDAAGQPSPAATVSPVQELAREAIAYPFVRVLGTAQDGGLPHVACNGTHCSRARQEPGFARKVASLAIVTGPDEVFLIDATPDLPQQLVDLLDLCAAPQGRVDRQPLSGVFLTHAHLGHYTGLMFLGFEAVHTQELPVFATERMVRYLRSNGPWSQLVEFGNIEPTVVEPGRRIALSSTTTVEAFQVPHRDELSDTVAFVVHGPNRSLLYVPDTDRWDTWTVPLLERLSEVDIALLDGSFFSLDELPGRSVEEIGHPLITTSLDLLEDRLPATEIYFTHLNHSNPAVDPASAETQEVERRGFRVLEDGREFPL